MNALRVTRLSGLLLGSIIALSAQAATLTQIEGEHTVFFYDADYWGTIAPTVQGDSISFALRPDFAVLAKVRDGTTTASQIQQCSDFASPGVVAVAKDGYNLKTYIGSGITGQYSTAANGSQVDATLSGNFYLGSVANNVFTQDGWITGGMTEFAATSVGAQTGGAIDVTTYAGNILPYAKTIGVESFLSTHVRQVGSGSAGLSLDSVNYQFSVVAIPEPHTYGMLLVGVLALGAWTRRRAS